MHKAISIHDLVEALTFQRTYMLVMANLNLNEPQMNALSLMYRQNEKLVELLGVPIPSLENLVRRHNEILYLEKLYRGSDEERSSDTIVIEDGQSINQEISGHSRVVSPEIGSDATS